MKVKINKLTERQLDWAIDRAFGEGMAEKINNDGDWPLELKRSLLKQAMGDEIDLPEGLQ